MVNNKTKQKYIARISKLIEEGSNLKIETYKTFTGYDQYDREEYETNKCLSYDSFVEWKTSCITILDTIVPKTSLHRNTVEELSSLNNELLSQKFVVSFLKSILKDFENGFFEDIETQVDAEISSDYLHQAEQLLSYGKSENKSYIPAAILSGAVLEHGLRTIAGKLEPPETTDSKGKVLMLGGLIEALKKRLVYNELTAKQLRYWADIRNAVAHGKFEDFDHEQIEAMVRGVSDFLSRYQ